jgi:hypothetical protein
MPITITGGTGPIGNTGDTGIQGVKGYIGETSLTGATGPIGIIGDQGIDGNVGPQQTNFTLLKLRVASSLMGNVASFSDVVTITPMFMQVNFAPSADILNFYYTTNRYYSAYLTGIPCPSIIKCDTNVDVLIPLFTGITIVKIN